MRVAFTPTEEQRRVVEMMAALMTPEDDICQVVMWPAKPKTGHRRARAATPINLRTLRKHFKNELATGRVRAKTVAVAKMWKKINADYWPAIQFYLKTQCGFREASVHELTGPNGAPLPVAQHGTVVFAHGDNGRRVKPANDEKRAA